jgi:hypothetical protein
MLGVLLAALCLGREQEKGSADAGVDHNEVADCCKIKAEGQSSFKTAFHTPASLPWLPRTCNSKLGI